MNTENVLEENSITPIEESVFFEDLEEGLVGYRECYVDIAPQYQNTNHVDADTKHS